MKTLIQRIFSNRGLYWSLVQNDFHARYNGSIFGIIWGFIQPIITVMVYWFVFQIGLRSGDRPDGTPYILWLICGIVPWFFFSEAVGATTNSFIEYGYLVKKVQFQVGMIPMIKIGSALIVHVVFVVFCTVILNFYGYKADWFYFQMLYYMAAMVFLLVGIGLFLSAVTVFFRDMSQIVAIIIQVGFWVIPIVWGSEVLPHAVKILFELNPVYYIVEGYRESLLTHVFFWSHPVQTIYYWSASLVMFLVGLKCFRRLKPSFADVL